WFMKADDDTYVVVENLRYFLASKNSSEPAYYGCKFKPYVRQGYMSGGAGYVLSKAALITFGEEGISPGHPDECKDNQDESSEDVGMGKCMEALGVAAGDSRDSLGRGRFFPFAPEHHIIPGEFLGVHCFFLSLCSVCDNGYTFTTTTRVREMGNCLMRG